MTQETFNQTKQCEILEYINNLEKENAELEVELKRKKETIEKLDNRIRNIHKHYL